MKKALFVLSAFALLCSLLNFNSCTSSTSNTVYVHDTVYQHYWDPEYSGVTSDLRSVWFSTLKVGTAVGPGAIIRTTDGGNTWNLQSNASGADLYAVSFSDVNHGIAIGSGGIALGTTNGGVQWIPLNVGAGVELRNAQVVSSTTAYIVGSVFLGIDNTEGHIFKTTDGGATWNELAITGAPGLYGISFIDAQNGWVSGNKGSIYKTTDGGATWTTENSTTTGTQVARLSFADQSHGMAVCFPGTPGIPGDPTSGYMLLTSDGGATWTKTATTNAMDDVRMADKDHAMAVGWNGAVMETDDGGTSWSTKYIGSSRLLEVFLNDPNNGAIVGLNGQLYVLGQH